MFKLFYNIFVKTIIFQEIKFSQVINGSWFYSILYKYTNDKEIDILNPIDSWKK
jgi:hypothetical protein